MKERRMIVCLTVFCVIIGALTYISFQMIKSIETGLRTFDIQSIQVLDTVNQLKSVGSKIITATNEYGFLVLAERADNRQVEGLVVKKNDEKMELNKAARAAENLLDIYAKLVMAYFPGENGFVNEIRLAVMRIKKTSAEFLIELGQVEPGDQLLVTKDEFKESEVFFNQVVERLFAWEKDEFRGRYEELVAELEVLRNTILSMGIIMVMAFGLLGGLVLNCFAGGDP